MSFNAEQFAENFMNAGVEGAMSTERPLPAEGQYHLRIVDDVTSDKDYRKIEVIGGSSQNQDGQTRPWLRMNVPMEIVDRIDQPGDTSSVGRLVRWSTFLDIDDAGKLKIDPDSNVNLGKLRAAVGQNQPGQSWNPHMLGGQLVIGQISHEPDRRDPSTKYARVSSVAAAT